SNDPPVSEIDSFPYTTLFRSIRAICGSVRLDDFARPVESHHVIPIGDEHAPVGKNPRDEHCRSWKSGGEIRKLRITPYIEAFDADRKSTRLNSSHSQISYAVF